MKYPFLPYGRQQISEDDIQAVVEVLRSDWLTTGPAVERFEQSVAALVEVPHAVAVSSGTAGLHAAMHAIGIAPGDEVIVPPMTFAATANAVVYQGGTPVFADVDPATLLLDPLQVEQRISSRTKAIVAVDYAGQPCDYQALQALAARHRLVLVADACHSLGAAVNNRPCGSLADLSVFSFHPVKPITTGEGGMVCTRDRALADRMRIFRNHGLSSDHRQRSEQTTWYYEMTGLGYNYRLTDLQCALGTSQLARLPNLIKKRQMLADRYDKAFSGIEEVVPLTTRPGVSHGYHLYVVRIEGVSRDRVFSDLRNLGIGVNVHYVPVYLHPYYRQRFGTAEGLCPVAEEAFGKILSLPIFPGMEVSDVDRVVAALRKALSPGSPGVPGEKGI